MNKLRLNVVLFQPQIPWNTGNAGRTCLAFGAKLHLIQPNFSLSASRVKRAGLDYWPSVDVTEHNDWDAFEKKFTQDPSNELVFFSKIDKIGEKSIYDFQFFDCKETGGGAAGKELALVFGSETTGLTNIASRIEELAAENSDNFGGIVFIPQDHTVVRSLNLSTSVGVGVFEAHRQHYYEDIGKTRE